MTSSVPIYTLRMVYNRDCWRVVRFGRGTWIGGWWVPEGWQESLDAPTRERARALIAQLEQLGAPEAEGWAYSEVTEDFPQLARYLVLRRLWSGFIDTYRDSPHWIGNAIRMAERDPDGPFADAGFALQRLVAAGVSEDDIKSVARAVAYEAVFSVLDVIDEGGDPDVAVPGWSLMETDAEGELTGRAMGGLHESILSLDPSGREGRPA